MQHVQGYIRSHWALPSGHYSIRIAPEAARETINKTTMQNVPSLLAMSVAIAMWRYYTACIAWWRRSVTFIKATKRRHRASTCSFLPIGLLLWPKTLMSLMSSLNSTTNSKSLIDIKATIDSNAWKAVGANRAPSEIYSPINLNDLLQKVIKTVSAVFDLEYPTIFMRDFLEVCILSNVGLHLESTISSWRWPILKWGAASCLKSFVVCRFAFVLIWLRLQIPCDIQSTNATTNWNVEEGLLSKDEALFSLVTYADQQEPQCKTKETKCWWSRHVWWSIKLKNWLMFESALMLTKRWHKKSLKTKSDMILLKSWR